MALGIAALLFAFSGITLTVLQVDEGVRYEDGRWVVEQQLGHDYHRYYPEAEQVEYRGNIGLYNVSTERYMELACTDWASRVLLNQTEQNLPARYHGNFTYSIGYKTPIRVHPFDQTATDVFRSAVPDAIHCIMHFQGHTYRRTVNITVPDQPLSAPTNTGTDPVTVTDSGYRITVASQTTCALPQDRWVNATVTRSRNSTVVDITGIISTLTSEDSPAISSITASSNQSHGHLTLHIVDDGSGQPYGCSIVYNNTVYSELEDEATKRTQYNLTIIPPAHITRITLSHANATHARTIGTINITATRKQRLEAAGTDRNP
ncbi:MAG: hypothetical protein SVU32_06665 [Candidatus Nanohaloarchaea archaeon]|nr:hypothetical protein [Candidatus Nanohaloarchaea archaeon]